MRGYLQRSAMFTQLFKFLLVGILNTALQYVVFVALYSGAGVNYLAASVAGYCVGMVNSYLLNRRWTFASANTRVLGEAAKFLAVNAVALAANTAVLFLLVTMLGVRPQLAQLWAIAGSIAVNFCLNRYWTFVPSSR